MRSTNAGGTGWQAPDAVNYWGEVAGCSLAVDAGGATHFSFQDAGIGALA